MNIGRLGVWAMVNVMTAADSAAFARRVEKWGYQTLWIPEVTARDPFVTCSWLLAHTTTLNLATGIASIYSRDPSQQSILSTRWRSNRAVGFSWVWACLTVPS